MTVIDRIQRFEGCLAGGAIGDAVGSFYEGRSGVDVVDFEAVYGLSDDTQLTLATCEAIVQEKGRVEPAGIARSMLDWYNRGKLSGLGASTLKALRDLQMGAHWGLSGRAGEFAAGNGAAMRIAPLAFFVDVDEERTLIRDVCNITHKNDEAYVGCLAILYALKFVVQGQWDEGVIDKIVSSIPDTGVRDCLIQLRDAGRISIAGAAELVGASGHVVESVPFAIYAATRIGEKSFEEVIVEIIRCGGDTDTNASLAGQMMGAYLGFDGFDAKSREVFGRIREAEYIIKVGAQLGAL